MVEVINFVFTAGSIALILSAIIFAKLTKKKVPVYVPLLITMYLLILSL